MNNQYLVLRINFLAMRTLNVNKRIDLIGLYSFYWLDYFIQVNVVHAYLWYNKYSICLPIFVNANLFGAWNSTTFFFFS